MNERIRARVMRGKLPDIKQHGSDRLDIPAILAQRKKPSKRPRTKRARAYDGD